MGGLQRFLRTLLLGAPLKVKYSDAKRSGLSIVDYAEVGKDIELGLAMFNRCCDLLQDGGQMCIVLPETYFFSPSYKYVRDWAKDRLKPICVANIPMDAFQGFCRAKTNLYVFEKLNSERTNIDLDRDTITFIDSQTCGIYKNGSDRYIVDPSGNRTNEIDNQLFNDVVKYSSGDIAGFTTVLIKETQRRDVLVPRYYDQLFVAPFKSFLANHDLDSVSIGELCDNGIITITGGHGSPSNDLRNGTIPYVKVSDIRNMRVNINPTNLIPIELARKFWKGRSGKSNLQAWDLISPSRASSNIGEFAILVPGEEQIVLTKEVFVLRVQNNEYGYTPFYMLWALCLQEVRNQWNRVTLMQTNREDVGSRYREVLIPKPKSERWAAMVSHAFSDYFQGIANAKRKFAESTTIDSYNYIASVSSFDAREDKNE